MARSDREWAEDILAAIADIRQDTAGMDFDVFAGKPVVVRSVLYSIEVIGEATKQLSDDYKADRPGTPWRAIAGMRDRLVHKHFRPDARRVWDIVSDGLGPLEASLRGSPVRGEKPDIA